jgi:hypothetical protein
MLDRRGFSPLADIATYSSDSRAYFAVCCAELGDDGSGVEPDLGAGRHRSQLANVSATVSYEPPSRRRAREALKLIRLPQTAVLCQTLDWFFEPS